MTKIKKILLTSYILITLIFTAVAPAFAYYGATGVSGEIWPPVLTGWTIATGGGNLTINWHFSDPLFGGSTGGGIPDLSAQYPDWDKPNNMDIVLWAQNHHYQMPLNSRFYWFALHPTDKQPTNYTGPAPCSYTPQIQSIIDASGYTPADFYNAGKAPLSGSAPKATTTSSPVSTPAPAPKTVSTPVATPEPPVVSGPPAPVVSKTQTPVSPEVAKQHSDPVSDPSSLTYATITKIDNAKQAADDKAQTDSLNRKRYIVYGLLALALVVSIGFVLSIYIREWRTKRK